MTEKLPFPAVWDSTMRGAFVSCPKKFYYEFIRKLAPSATSVHLHFGGAFAKALEDFRTVYYDPESDLDPARRFDHAYAIGAGALLEYWGDYEAPEGQPKTLENCLLAFDAYLQRWPPETDYVQPYISNGKAAVEFTFAIPLDVLHPDTNEPLIYAGRFDMLGLYNDQLWTVDEKTTTRLGAQWLKQWDLRSQFIGYNWAAQQYEYKVAGALVRGTAIKAKGFDFAEVPVMIPQWKIDNWREQLSRDLTRAIECYRSGYWDFDFDSACTSYGGCSFLQLCNSPNPERWVDTYYTTRHWNPLAADPSAPPEDEGEGKSGDAKNV